MYTKKTFSRPNTVLIKFILQYTRYSRPVETGGPLFPNTTKILEKGSYKALLFLESGRLEPVAVIRKLQSWKIMQH